MPSGRVAAGFAIGGLAALLAVDLGLLGLVLRLDDAAPLVVATALVSGAAFATRLRPLVVGGAWVAGLLWLAVAFTPLSRWLADGLVRRDAQRPADAVLVLGSRLQADGQPTTAAMSRLLHGLALVAQGHAPRLIVTELQPPARSHADLARAWLRGFNLEAEVIALGPVRNTHDEALATGELFRTRAYRTLLLVTSPTHTRRAAATLERQGIEVISSPAVETLFDLETLDLPSERLAAFGAILHERVGFWVYARRGWVGQGALTAPAATSP